MKNTPSIESRQIKFMREMLANQGPQTAFKSARRLIEELARSHLASLMGQRQGRIKPEMLALTLGQMAGKPVGGYVVKRQRTKDGSLWSVVIA